MRCAPDRRPRPQAGALRRGRAGLPQPGLWFEVHPENYMVDGGPRLAWLEAVRQRHPVVAARRGAVAGGRRAARRGAPAPAGRARAARAAGARLRAPGLVAPGDGNYLPGPAAVSAHRRGAAAHRRATWSRCRTRWDGASRWKTRAHYLRIDGHAWDEIEFLAELARRTGCGAAAGRQQRARRRTQPGLRRRRTGSTAFPAELVSEVHLAGHTPDPAWAQALLVDSHDAPVAPEVWALYARLRRRARAAADPDRARRQHLPDFRELLAERSVAAAHAARRPACEAPRHDGPCMSDVSRWPLPGRASHDALLAARRCAVRRAGGPARLRRLPQHRDERLRRRAGGQLSRVARLVGDAIGSGPPPPLMHAANPAARPAPVVLRRQALPISWRHMRAGGRAALSARRRPARPLLDRGARRAQDARRSTRTRCHPGARRDWRTCRLAPHPSARGPGSTGSRSTPSGGATGKPTAARTAPRGLARRRRVLLRPGASVTWRPLDAAGCAFLDACADGQPLGMAAAAAAALAAACRSSPRCWPCCCRPAPSLQRTSTPDREENASCTPLPPDHRREPAPACAPLEPAR